MGVLLTKQDVKKYIRKLNNVHKIIILLIIEYHYTFLLMLPWLLPMLLCQLLLLMSSRHSCSPVALFEAPMEKYCPQDYMDIKVNTILLFTAYEDLWCPYNKNWVKICKNSYLEIRWSLGFDMPTGTLICTWHCWQHSCIHHACTYFVLKISHD